VFVSAPLFVLDPPVDELPIELLEDEPPALEPLEAANAGAAATRRAETAVAIVSVFMFPPLGTRRRFWRSTGGLRRVPAGVPEFWER